MTNQTPRISVIVPTRHRNDLLARCLDCLAPGSQQFAPELYEVIVTDDGKTETAESMIGSAYPWARWVQGPRRGPAANRNFGATQARGDWLAFTDDDCLPDALWLQTLNDAVRPDIGVYEGRTTSRDGVPSPLSHAPTNDTGGNLWSCNMMIRRTLHADMGGFDESFPQAHMEDIDFRERLMGRGEAAQFVPAALVDHPPRRLAIGSQNGPQHESEFMFYYKSGHTKPYLAQHLRRVLIMRLRYIQRFPLNGDSLRFALAIIPELGYILRHGPAWQQKYRQVYRGVQSPYSPGLPERVGQR